MRRLVLAGLTLVVGLAGLGAPAPVAEYVGRHRAVVECVDSTQPTPLPAFTTGVEAGQWRLTLRRTV